MRKFSSFDEYKYVIVKNASSLHSSSRVYLIRNENILTVFHNILKKRHENLVANFGLIYYKHDDSNMIIYKIHILLKFRCFLKI